VAQSIAWSPNEEQIYRCCHEYGNSGSSTFSYEYGDLLLYDTGSIPGSAQLNSAWLWDNQRVILPHILFDRIDSGNRQRISPLLLPTEQSWQDLNSILGLPEETWCGVHQVGSDRTSIVLSCQDGTKLADLQTGRTYQISPMQYSYLPLFSSNDQLVALSNLFDMNGTLQVDVYDTRSHNINYTVKVSDISGWHPALPQLLVTSQDRGSVMVIDLADPQEPVVIDIFAAELETEFFLSAFWTPDGSVLVVTNDDKLVWLEEVGRGEYIVITPPLTHIREVKFSPDGRLVAFVSGSLGSVSQEDIFIYPLPEKSRQYPCVKMIQ
jgi:WD40 repeat protein